MSFNHAAHALGTNTEETRGRVLDTRPPRVDVFTTEEKNRFANLHEVTSTSEVCAAKQVWSVSSH
jgi:hypothetical protein